MTIAANGSTWFSATRLRHSTSRSLRATQPGTCATLAALGRAVDARRAHRRPGRRRPRRCGWPARRPARARGWPRSTVAPDAAAARSVASSSSRPAASRPACGSSSSHSAGPPGDQAGQRGAPLLAGGEPAHGQRRRGGRSARGAPCAASTSPAVAPTVAPPEAHVLGAPSGPGRARCGGRAGRPAAHLRRDRWPGRDRARRPAPAGQRQQPGAHPQQRRLAGAVGAPQQHDLALPDASTCTGQRREAAEHGDGVVELDDTGASIAGRRYRRRPGRADRTSPAAGTVAARADPIGSRERHRRRRRVARAGTDPPRATRLALGRRHHRQGADRHRPPDVRLRRLPAVGHGHRVRPGPGPSSTPSSRTAGRRRPSTTDADGHHARHDRPDDPVVAPRRPTPTVRRRRRPRRPRPRPVPASSAGDAVARIEIPSIGARRQGRRRASRRPTSSAAPATTPTRRCPGSSATPRSPVTARPTASRSADLDRVAVGDEIIVTTVKGRFVYRMTAARSSPVGVGGRRHDRPDAWPR